MKQALKALEYPLITSHEAFDVDMAELLAHRAIESLRQAITEAEKQEPVAWMDKDGDIYKELPNEYWNPPHTPIYAQRTWVGLTDEEVSDLWCEVSNTDFVTADTHVFSQAIQAKFKEKNV